MTELIEQNKEALLQEIGLSINESVNALQEVMTTQSESREAKIDLLYSSLMMISQNLGYLAACYNQYMIFVNGSLPNGEASIGFKAMVDNIKDKKNG